MMRNVIYILVILFLLTVSCDKGKKDKQDIYSTKDEALFYPCLIEHVPTSEMGDNYLYFCREGVGPIMYSINVRKRGQYIYAEYHWNNTNTVISDTIFFQGFYFQIDSVKWNVLARKSKELLSKTTDESYTDGGTGGTHYVLSYSGKSIVVNRAPMEREFQEFSNYIIDSFIEPVERLRRNGGLIAPRPDL